MEKKELLDALKKLKEETKKRKFKQSVDMVVNLKGLNLKKTEEQVDFFVTLNHSVGRKVKVAGLVGPELKDEAAKSLDFALIQEDFDKYQQNKKLAKKLAREYDFFVAQGNIMAKVAAAFGRAFGPLGKMPNPKAGLVVPPKTPLKPLYEKLQRTVHVKAKVAPIVQIAVGNEEMNEDEVVDNILVTYDNLIHHLPGEKNNIKSIYLKLTMGKPVKVL